MAISDYCFVGQSIILLLRLEYMKSMIRLIMDSQVVKSILGFSYLDMVVRKKVIIVNQRRLMYMSDTIGLANFARPSFEKFLNCRSLNMIRHTFLEGFMPGIPKRTFYGL